MRWIENINNPSLVGPLVIPGLFQAGATATAAEGDLLERTADTNTKFVPIDSDHDATVTKLAIAKHPIASGDLLGFYDVIAPREGDVFEADLAAASAVAPEQALYYSSPTAVATSGSNILGYAYFGPNHPGIQGRLSQGQLGDKGVTYRSTNKVRFIFRKAVSILSLYERA